MQPELLKAVAGDIPLQQEVPAQAIPPVCPPRLQSYKLTFSSFHLSRHEHSKTCVSNNSPKFPFF